MVYMTDGLRMIVARSCYRHGVFPECQATVNYDTESLHVIGHRQIDARYRYRRHGRSNSVQLIRSADDQCFRLVRVQLQSVLYVPLLDVTSAVHAARTDSPSDVLSACMTRRSCISSAYWWYCTPWLAKIKQENNEWHIVKD